MESDFKDRIKEWLRAQGYTREWLATRCGVEVKTINNWLSSNRPIPSKAVLILQQLIEATPLPPGSEPAPENVLVVKIDDRRFDAYSEKALEEGRTLRDWVVNTLDEAAELDNITPLYSTPPKVPNSGTSKVADGIEPTGSITTLDPVQSDPFPGAGDASTGGHSPHDSESEDRGNGTTA